MGAMTRFGAMILPLVLVSCVPREQVPPEAAPGETQVAPGEVEASAPQPESQPPTAGLEAQIVDVGLVAECSEDRALDPLAGSVVVSYENPRGGTGALEIVRTEVAFASALEGWSYSVELAHPKSVVSGAGAKQRVTHERVGRAPGSAMLCSFCGNTGKLSMTWRAPDGSEQSQVRDFELECPKVDG